MISENSANEQLSVSEVLLCWLLESTWHWRHTTNYWTVWLPWISRTTLQFAAVLRLSKVSVYIIHVWSAHGTDVASFSSRRLITVAVVTYVMLCHCTLQLLFGMCSTLYCEVPRETLTVVALSALWHDLSCSFRHLLFYLTVLCSIFHLVF